MAWRGGRLSAAHDHDTRRPDSLSAWKAVEIDGCSGDTTADCVAAVARSQLSQRRGGLSGRIPTQQDIEALFAVLFRQNDDNCPTV
jgi:hypothetical protein